MAETPPLAVTSEPLHLDLHGRFHGWCDLNPSLAGAACAYRAAARLRASATTAAELEQSARLYRQSAANGYPLAMYEYGRICLEADGVPPAQEEGLVWLTAAAAHGIPAAQFLLGLTLALGVVGPPDLAAARDWLTRAAAAGHPDAAQALAALDRRSS